VPKGTLNSCMTGITQNEENRYILIETIDEPYAKKCNKDKSLHELSSPKGHFRATEIGRPLFLVPPMQLLDGIEGMPYIIIYIYIIHLVVIIYASAHICSHGSDHSMP